MSMGEIVRASGYAPDTPLVVGVSPGPGDQLFFAQGVGGGGVAFGAESVAYAGSLAKQITGACAAILAQRGVLDPDAPIGEWLPELPAWRERVRAPT